MVYYYILFEFVQQINNSELYKAKLSTYASQLLPYPLILIV